MIDPDNITNFNATDNQLEEMLLFWILVAGKSADTISKALDKLLTTHAQGNESPFEIIKNIGKRRLPNKFKSHGIGCFNDKAKYVWNTITAGLDLRTCSVEELEAIKGIGSKTSKCFLLHSRPGLEYAGLDTHILKYLRDKGYKAPKATPAKGSRQYLELERAFLKLAKASGKSVAEFDLDRWRKGKDGRKAKKEKKTIKA